MWLIVPCLHNEPEVNALLAFRALKGPWRELFFGSFHPMKDRKRGSFIFFMFSLYYWGGVLFSSFSAGGESAEWNFSVRHAKNQNCICFLRTLLYSNVPSHIVDILTLESPHKLLKNHGTISKYATYRNADKVQSKSTFFKIRILYPGYNGIPFHASVPLKTLCPAQ